MKADFFRLDDEFREAFENFKARPPASVWYGIVDELPVNTSRRKIPQVWFIAAGFALLIASSISLWVYTGSHVELQEIATLPPDYGHNNTILTGNKTDSLLLADANDKDGTNIEKNNPSVKVAQRLSKEILSSGNISGSPAIVSSLEGQVETVLPSIVFEEIPEKATPVAKIQIAEQSIVFDFDQQEVVRPRIDLGGHFAMQYSFRSMSHDPSLLTSSSLPGVENRLMTFDAGISLTLSTRSRLSLQTGINYSTMGQFVNSIDVLSNPDLVSLLALNSNKLLDNAQTILTSHGFIRFDNPGMSSAINESTGALTSLNAAGLGQLSQLELHDYGFMQMFSFIEVPLVARFRMLDHGLHMHMKGGVSASYLVGNNVFAGQGNLRQSIGQTFGLRKLNFEGIAGVVMEVPITRNISLQLEPTVQFFFFPMIDGFTYFGRSVPYSFSLFTGITYGF
ncbi:MAG TPA: hypothetical protein VLH61_10820 [Bacteroidales bacterium]|nr:hypothetical protein [Bacteroidales bacterium]